MSSVLHVALDLPIAPYFDYFPGHWALTPGQWVWVPWGQRVRIGLVIAVGKPAQWSPDRIREVLAPVEGLEAIDAWSLSFWQQVADYYHCAIGELLVASLPKALRTVQATSKPLAGPWAAVNKAWQRWQASRPDKPPAVWHRSQLRAQQAEVLDCLIAQPEGFAPSLLHGITGSGKTLVYLSYIMSLIEKNPKAQVLLLVPEIGLTPQLAQTLESALAPSTIAILHSGLADNLRAAVWLAASRGELRLIVGTRSAIFVPLPHLAAIIVDEEHDPSYKQWESVRYQARDLAVWRAQSMQIPVILGSATPSMESWHAADRGRYRRLSLTERANLLPPPTIELVDMRQIRQPLAGLAPRSRELIASLLSEQAQVLIFLNRRGFAPLLQCAACTWVSPCAACSAYQVLHRQAGRFQLICHHCGQRAKVPRFCPQCGNSDLSAQGRGTQKLEEELQAIFPQAKLARLDRDAGQGKHLVQTLAAIHRGDIDLVVGTQMLAKGHDWARLQAVVVLEADNGLFAADFRATERLFANLMQVAGRPGRSHTAFTQAPIVLIQTAHPDHPLFADVRAHDFQAHALKVLDERKALGLPPYRHHVLLRVQAKQQQVIFEFLEQAKQWFERWIRSQGAQVAAVLRCYDPVPMNLARVDHWHRAQLLLEAGDRPLMHRCLSDFHADQAQQQNLAASLHWCFDVDPQDI
ncbi:MAG: primosomal protein N' [Betaproteobacteria bacterium]|nr:primosomal protein N' [Betaproteobacteria bacterium]